MSGEYWTHAPDGAGIDGAERVAVPGAADTPDARPRSNGGSTKAKPKKGATKKGHAKKRVETEKPAAAKIPAVDPATLRGPVDAAKAALDAAETEAEGLVEMAAALKTEARAAYHLALTPYRAACRKAGVACEFEGGRGANVAEKVSFEVVKTAKGVRVTVKGKPDTAEMIPMAALEESVNRAAYAFTEKHVGPREKVGNKGGSLSNRLRAVLR